MNLYEYVTNSKNFSYISNITYNTGFKPLAGAGAGAAIGGMVGGPVGAGVGALIGAGAGTAYGVGKGVADEAIGNYRLKKAGFQRDKQGFITITDSDGNDHKVHLNSIKSRLSNSQSKHNPYLKNWYGRTIHRLSGVDVPMGYKEDNIININPWMVDYDNLKTKGLTYHEIGHKMDPELDREDAYERYALNSQPFEETADRYAIKNGIPKQVMREATEQGTRKATEASLDGKLLKALVGKKKYDQLVTETNKKYRGNYLYDDDDAKKAPDVIAKEESQAKYKEAKDAFKKAKEAAAATKVSSKESYKTAIKSLKSAYSKIKELSKDLTTKIKKK